MKQFLLPLIIFLYFGHTAGQSADSVRLTENIYYSSFKDKLGIYLYGITKFNKFDMNSADKRDRISYAPNENFNIGLGFNYKWMGIGAAFNFGFINNDDALYGETTSFDFQVDLYGRNIFGSASLQAYKGFYWDNVDDYIPGWNSRDSTILRPDIGTFTLSGNFIYVFNDKKFSFKAAFVNNEWQKKSAGSWLAGSYFSVYAIGSDSSLIPDVLSAAYPVFDSVNYLGSLTFGGAFGYTYSLVIKKHFYLNLALMIGIALQNVKAVSFEGYSLGSDTRLSTKAHSRFAIGYNKEKYYFGLSVIVDSYLVQNRNRAELNYNYGKVKIFYGRRFNIGRKKN